VARTILALRARPSPETVSSAAFDQTLNMFGDARTKMLQLVDIPVTEANV